MAIEEIQLRRDGPGGAADSHLWFYKTGNAFKAEFRDGEPFASFPGQLGAGDFDALADVVRSNHFFDLEDHYGEASPADAHSTTTVVRDDVAKTVTDNGAAPPNLVAIQQAVDSLAVGIDWIRHIPPPAADGHGATVR
jgi:hypothetical protein